MILHSSVTQTFLLKQRTYTHEEADQTRKRGRMSKPITHMLTAPANEAGTDQSVKTRGLFKLHLAVFLFGFTGLFGKLLPVPPDLIAFARVFLASIALLIALIARKQTMKLQRGT